MRPTRIFSASGDRSLMLDDFVLEGADVVDSGGAVAECAERELRLFEAQFDAIWHEVMALDDHELVISLRRLEGIKNDVTGRRLRMVYTLKALDIVGYSLVVAFSVLAKSVSKFSKTISWSLIRRHHRVASLIAVSLILMVTSSLGLGPFTLHFENLTGRTPERLRAASAYDTNVVVASHSVSPDGNGRVSFMAEPRHAMGSTAASGTSLSDNADVDRTFGQSGTTLENHPSSGAVGRLSLCRGSCRDIGGVSGVITTNADQILSVASYPIQMGSDIDTVWNFFLRWPGLVRVEYQASHAVEGDASAPMAP